MLEPAQGHRRDIDGLRCLAVLPVVLFHAGIAGFSGGYVGVDVFFVISGYLISGIILRELEAGRFSLVTFYERRVRRIFPAMIVMMLFVAAMAPLALLPSELRTLPKEMLGTLAFVANIVFWGRSGYFAEEAEQKPLLHMWSLGVEEQFYIFVPLLLWLLVAFAPGRVRAALLAVFGVSLGLSVWLTPGHPDMAFYLLPARAWELLAGALLATLSPRAPVAGRGAAIAAASGVALIVYAVLAFDESVAFPGAAAILPVAGSVLILRFAPGTVVGRGLGLPPLVFVGLISYSLYLWHWPLIVFFRDFGWLEHPWGPPAVTLCSVAAAWASWRHVEQPFRNRARWHRAGIFTAAAAGTMLVAGLAVALRLTDGWESRFPEDVQRYDRARADISPERGRCHIGDGLRPAADWCRLGADRPAAALWGDSHGVELAYALAEAGLPLLQITYSSCPPSIGYERPTRPDCAAHNRAVLDYLTAARDITTVILIANYANYARQDGDGFWQGFAAARAGLAAAGKTVVVLGPIPAEGRNIPTLATRGRVSHFPAPPTPPQLAAGADSTAVIPLTELLCDGGGCPVVLDGMPLLFDSHHLSMTAARHVAPALVRWISALMDKAPPERSAEAGHAAAP